MAHHEQAANYVNTVEDVRKRAYLRLGMASALMDMKVLESNPEFDLLVFVRILDKMFDDGEAIASVLDGSFADKAWFSDGI